MRLMEVVRGKASAPDALATGAGSRQALKKLPLLTGNAFGFVGNRLYAAYRRQCEFMVEEGAWPEQVDAALEAFGFAMGPFAVADLSGLDIAWRMRQAQAATRDPAARYVTSADRLCEAGRLGRKTGAGYYRYDEGGKRRRTMHVARVIEQARADKGIVAARWATRRSTPGDAGARQRSGAAAGRRRGRRATDVDVVLVNGYGFPRWEGGPVFWAGTSNGTRHGPRLAGACAVARASFAAIPDLF